MRPRGKNFIEGARRCSSAAECSPIFRERPGVPTLLLLVPPTLLSLLSSKSNKFDLKKSIPTHKAVSIRRNQGGEKLRARRFFFLEKKQDYDFAKFLSRKVCTYHIRNYLLHRRNNPKIPLFRLHGINEEWTPRSALAVSRQDIKLKLLIVKYTFILLMRQINCSLWSHWGSLQSRMSLFVPSRRTHRAHGAFA